MTSIAHAAGYLDPSDISLLSIATPWKSSEVKTSDDEGIDEEFEFTVNPDALAAAVKFANDQVAKSGENVQDQSKRDRKKALFLFLLTGLYLLFELAFNARLLDVVGTTVDEADIDRIEIAGRLISGCALTLGFWSLAIKSSLPLKASFARMAIVAIACFAASYVIQERILTAISEDSDPAQRRAAATLVMLTEGMHEGDVSLSGFDLSEIDAASPEAKTFYAVFPAMTLFSNNLQSKTETELFRIVERRVTDALGGFAEFYNSGYVDTEPRLKAAYNAYAKISPAYVSAINSIPTQQSRLYREYRNGLGRHTPYTLPKHTYRDVGAKVRSKGVPVPYNWDPRDKEGFLRAVEEEIKRTALMEYQIAIESALGFFVKPGLGPEAFFRSDDIQRQWWGSIGLKKPSIHMLPDLSPEAFRRDVFDPLVKEMTQERVTSLLAPVEDYAQNGRLEQEGELAIRIAFVPLVAFAFSMAGALFHIVKTSWLASKSISRRRGFQLVVSLAALCGTLWYFVPAARMPNDVTTSELFVSLQSHVASKSGPILAEGIRSLVQVQAAFYPLAEGIRTHILQGYDFGVVNRHAKLTP